MKTFQLPLLWPVVYVQTKHEPVLDLKKNQLLLVGIKTFMPRTPVSSANADSTSLLVPMFQIRLGWE